MTIKELENAFNIVRQYLEENLAEKLNEIASNDLAGLISNRVELKGEDSEGNKFTEYSKGYKKSREKKGKQTDFKDFSFTRDMWLNFDVVRKEKDAVYLGGKSKSSQDKIDWSTMYEEISIIAANKEELALVEGLLLKWCLETVKKYTKTG